MGKTTVAAMIQDVGIDLLDSDQVVHKLYSAGSPAISLVEAAFPNSISSDGSIDRSLLSRHVVGKPDALKQLEGIIHPLVHEEKRKFITEAAQRHSNLVVLDIPLLYETGADADCDAVMVVSAPSDIQRARVLARPGMTPEKLDALLSRQLSDEEKRKRADFIIDTGTSLEETKGHVVAVIDALQGRPGKAFHKIQHEK